MDILDEKLKYSNFEDHFPEYVGPKNDTNAVKMFMKDTFTNICDAAGKKPYPHFTCATGTYSFISTLKNNHLDNFA